MKVAINASVNKKDALRYLGHKGQSLDSSFEEAFDRIASKVNALQASGVTKHFCIESIKTEGVALEGTSFVLPGSNIANHLSGAIEVVLLAATLGFDSERLLKQLACVSATDALMADACASSMVENAAETLTQEIRAEAEQRNMKCGKRFSPGYGDFPLAVQREFISAIGADKTLGIQVTEGDLMVPAKSITAVIPLFGEDRAATQDASSKQDSLSLN